MIPWGVLLDLRVLLGIALVAMGIYAKVQTLRMEEAKAEFAQFRADVESEAAKARVSAARREVVDLERKGKADAENRRVTDDLRADVKRLRDANASRSRLPEAPSGSIRPDLACFDRAEYQRADGIAVEKLFAGARGLADEGTAATVDLDTAKLWASNTAGRNEDISSRRLSARIELFRSTVQGSLGGCRF